MKDEVAVVCSRADPASLNIFERLLGLAPWEDRGGFLACGPWRLFIHEERQSSLRGLDLRLADLGLSPKMVIFACRHESKAGLPWFGGHFTGTFEEGRRELSAAAPSGLASFLRSMRANAPEGFSVSAEATHHGPTDMSTPCFFAEIGSSNLQWADAQVAKAVARAILSTRIRELPVFLGFGGGHYVQRQTELMFEADIAFGHLFSSYMVGSLDADLVDEARFKSGASYAYLDRKSLRSEDRKRIMAILEDLGLPLMRGRDIRTRFPISRD